MKKVAFTLAEVLITLGIIGVIAALTIPTLINKYNQHVFNTQFKKAYSTISNAHAAARNEWGTVPVCYYKRDSLTGEAVTTDCNDFSSLFLEQFKIGTECGLNAMANGCIPKYKGAEQVKQENNPHMSEEDINNAMVGCTNVSTSALRRYPAFILNDGTIIMPAAGSNTERISVNLIVDINGKKAPNKWGYDIFYFYTYFNNSKFSLETDGGCMPIEKGGRSTEQMLKYATSH